MTTKIDLVASMSMLALVCLAAACSHRPGREDRPWRPAGEGLYNQVIDFYSGPLDHLAAVRAGSCPMHPSCSQYSRQAVARYGLARGWVMTMDRLMRCGRDETRLAPRILVDGKWKAHDPLEANAIISGAR